MAIASGHVVAERKERGSYVEAKAGRGTEVANELRLRLPPRLPMCVFTSTETWHEQRVGALAMYCSDGRYGDAFDEFCHRRLSIPKYDRFAVPGGPAWIVGSAEMQKAAREQLAFLVGSHGLERIVLITHFGCGHYLRLGGTPETCIEAQTADVLAAAKRVREWFPKVRAEGYLTMREGSVISFHDLGA